MKKIVSMILSISIFCSILLWNTPIAKASNATISPEDVVSVAESLVGKYPKYISGGRSPSDGGFDCSGLVYYVFHTCLGSDVTYTQIWNRSAGTKIENRSDFQKGDIVFGLNSSGGWHTGIYIGNNTMIHSGSSKGVSKTTMSGWFTVKFARRLTTSTQQIGTQPSNESTPAIISNGTYTLTPQCAPDLRLDVASGSTENKANIQIYQNNNTVAQQFEFAHVGDGYYSITAKVSGKCLDVQEGKKASGTNVWQYTPNSTDAQKWRLEDAGDGYYYIIPKLNTGLCLDVYAAKSENRTNVQVYNKNQTSAQKWRLIPTDVPPENTAAESSPVSTYYTVTLNANGGQVSSTSTTVKQGSTYETLPIPTQSGYIFDGWYTAISGGEKVTATSSLAANSDHTLYAHWTADALCSGIYGSLNFSLSYDGTLTISGTGSVDPFFVGNGSSLEKCADQIKHIVIREGITSIFNGCRYMPNLVDVELPLSLTSIGLSSFIDCPSLKTIYIPQNVSDISFISFRGCSSLTNIQISDQNSWYSSMDGVVFNKAQNTLLLFPEGRSGKYTIPSGVTTVEYGAFSKEALQNLHKLEIPKSVTEIKCDDWQADNWRSVKLLVYSGSYGEEFAKKNSLNYEVVDKITVRLDLGSLLG